MTRKLARKVLLQVAATLFLLTGTVNAPLAADLEEYEKALDLISKAADQICAQIPLQGQGENLELTGKAKAQLNGAIAKLADIGIEGAAKYQQMEYQGLLQQDLVKALENSTNCKLVIWKDLQDRLLPRNNPPESSNELFDKLRSADLSARVDAAMKLEAMGKPAAAACSKFVFALHDNDLIFVEKVCGALVSIDSVAANPYLLQL